jgi:hypothetical protein
MRFAISGIARRGGRKKASQVCAFVRGCKAGRRCPKNLVSSVLSLLTNFVADFERMTPYIRELGKKQVVTSQSLEKIEDGKSDPTTSNNPLYSISLPCWLIPAAYAIVVRSSEYDLSPEMLDDIVATSISSYGGQTFGRRREADNSDDDDERV